ncbi:MULTISPECIES: sulfur oxidation c-type cytochrome SoxA [Maritimibacter]|jgi:sulfur-oxidizing protein SoxA|uniref:sulfur oxidation c-type cytochrome SoxA n=1 Tax=Maritimibacter TaxID=404235 RepID=UPI001108DC19|nr:MULTISPECIES: sulfur oxidation c-type cytochrome SoxA [Maritimibacter]MBL6426124.1 sulfur oxidation c-type cytochrome SoxA [Maritimibacter sp.]
MKAKLLTGIAAAALAFGAGAAMADEDAELVINGEIEIVTKTAAPAHLDGALDEIMSGWRFRDDTTQAMQMDDFDNPAMLAVEDALEIWATADGSEGKSCMDCHGAAEDMAGVKPVYPKWNEAAGEVYTLQMQVNDCRENRMGAEPWKVDASDALAMEGLLSSVSRGMPMNVAIDGPAQSTWEQGKELYYTRTGQLDLSCATCHEQNYGNMIRADHLSMGMVNGFPTYRLKDTKLVGVQSRFKGCVRDTRAETYSPGSPEFIALELYVASRANGLSVEGPAVRN